MFILLYLECIRLQLIVTFFLLFPFLKNHIIYFYLNFISLFFLNNYFLVQPALINTILIYGGKKIKKTKSRIRIFTFFN